MTARLQHLEDIFPNLAAVGYSPKSEPSAVYNCVAYAAGDESRSWEGYREPGYYWPADALEGHTFEALKSAFECLGYEICDDDRLDPDFDKVALFVDQDGLWTHAAKQCADGQWTIACYMKRKRNP